MYDKEIDITVHRFVLDPEKGSQPLSQNILAEATRFVISTTRETRWRTPPCVDLAQFAIKGPCFQYHCFPKTGAIREPFHSATSSRTPKEWDENVAPEDHELCSLADLEEFDHGHLHPLLESRHNGSPIANPATDAGPVDQCLEGSTRKRPPADSSAPPPEKKRPKLDAPSLRSLIPPPHFYPPLFAHSADAASLLPSATWPTAEGFSPIHPHTRDTCEEYLEDPYTRLAWIIPIRGCLEWEDATSASVLSDIGDSDSAREVESPPAPCIDGSREILWTTDALAQFWDVLKGLREARNLGALSISFYAVPSGTTVEQYSYFGSHKQTTPSSPSSVASVAEHRIASATDLGPIRSPLRVVDHFKIYHDAPYTQIIRSALHGWSYRNGGQKTRLLKGAKLVLVDERSKGLLLC